MALKPFLDLLGTLESVKRVITTESQIKSLFLWIPLISYDNNLEEKATDANENHACDESNNNYSVVVDNYLEEEFAETQ